MNNICNSKAVEAMQRIAEKHNPDRHSRIEGKYTRFYDENDFPDGPDDVDDYSPHKEFIKDFKKVFLELKNVYNIPVPNFDCKYNNSTEEVEVIVDIVEGKTLGYIGSEHIAFKSELGDLFKNILNYLKDKLKKGEEYLSEIYNVTDYMVKDNFNPDVPPNIFLIDLDPGHARHYDLDYPSEDIIEFQNLKKMEKN